MAFSMSDYMRDKQKETSAPGTSVPRATGFSMSKYLAGAEQTPTSVSGAVARKRNEQIAATKAKVDAYNAPLRQAAEYRKQANDYFIQRTNEYMLRNPQVWFENWSALETRRMDEARLAELRKQAEEEAEVINWMLPAAKLIYQTHGTPTQKEIAKLEEKIAQENLERQYELIQNAPLPGVTNRADEEWLRNMILNPQPDPEAVAQYNAQKDALKAAADAEQAQVLSPDNLLLKSFVTHGSPSTITQGMQEIFQYIDWLKQSPEWLKYNQYTAAEQEEEKKAELAETAKWAKENPVIGSAASVGTSVLSGADYLSKAIETATVGQPVASSTPGLSEITQSIRGGVSEDMSGTGQFFYDIGMSTADSYAAMAAGSGIDDALFQILGKHAAGAGGGIILALGAASNTANDIKSRGGSDQQALVGGAVAGVLEGVFEKYSIGNLKAMKSVSGKGVKNILSNVAKNVLVNASEETATELGNIIFDRVFMQELSNYTMMVDSYMKQGISEESAKLLANEMLRQQVGAAALSGALQGLFSGGIETTSSLVSDYLKDHKTYNINDTQSLINYAMSFPPETASYQMAEQLKGKKDITSAEEGALIRTISQDIEQGNHKANPATETISPGGNGNGQVTAKIAPAAAQAAKETVSREPVEVIRRANAQAAQQNEKTAAETQRDVSHSNTSIETLRNSIAESYENGTISAEEYDAAMESVYELESLDEASGDALDAYDPERLRRMEANDNGRSSVTDEGGEWAASQSAGEQAGELAEGTGRDQSREVQAQRAASRRDDVSRYYESTGRQAVSAREYFGNNKVNKVSTVQEVPAEMVEADSELQSIAEDIRAMGLTPHFFVGDARLRNGNRIDGMIRDGDVFIRVDGDGFSATHNWDHEKAHAIFRQSPGIEAELYGKIVGRGKAARRKLHQTMQRYREAYHGIYDVDENGNEIWNDTVQEMILQEILADAYAGKDTFAQGVEEYADIARDAASQIESRGGEVRGPPDGNAILIDGEQFALQPYSEKQKSNWRLSKKIIVYENAQQLLNFVRNALNDKTNVQKMYFGIVSGDLANEIRSKTGFDFEGLNVTLRADNVRKIVEDHGKEATEKPRGQRAVTENDFILIPDVIGSPDDIIGSVYKGKPAAEFKKTIDGSKVTVIAVYSGSSSLDLYVQTMYAGAKKGSVANLAAANASANTPKASVGTTSNKNVPQSEKAVKINEQFSASGVESNTAGNVPNELAKEHNELAVNHFGRTFKWAETGYILLDGRKLDFSGRHEGASGGYRTVDHRDIRDALGDDYGGDSYSGGMVQFMAEGNIRIEPESGGINLSVKPTKAQLDALSDFISRNRGEVILDLDDVNGNTLSSTEYPKGTHANKVLQDIKNWFENGEEPHVSELAQFRFSAGKAAQKNGADPIEAMPTKARQVMERAEKKLQRSLSDVLNLPKKMPEGVLEGVSREISREFLETGTVSDETIDRTFEQVYSAIESEVKRQRGVVDAEDYRQWAERDYIAEIGKHLAEMRLVKRYAEEKSQQKKQSEQDKAMTLSDLKKVYTDLKAARRGVDKAVARNLLTEQDNRRVNQLLRGDIDLDMLQPGVDNVRGITEVYNAKLEYEKFARQIRRWNAARKEDLRALADKLLATASDWKDKGSGWLYSRETMERNIRDIVPDKKVAQEIIDTLFKPIHDGAAAANRMKNQYRDRVRKLELSRKVAEGNTISEAAAVQLLGEAEDNIRHLKQNRFLSERDGKTLEDWQGIVRDFWEQNPNLDAGKIRRAVKEFSDIYDELFEQMNEVRMRNGYEPVNYREGYFPHFQSKDGDGILGKFGKSLGINTAAMQLPTTINGITHTFKPGIQWFGSAQQRMGVNTAFDAVEGFDSYIEGVADVIHQTDNIQRLRAFAAQVRYRTSEEGIRKQVDAIQNDPARAPEDKRRAIEELYAEGKFELGNLAVELDEYTNLLAGKKSFHDRKWEQRMGRGMYAIMKALESRVAANMVAINPGSWLTNFIPLAQGVALLDTKSLLASMWDTLRMERAGRDEFALSSSFLTNRRGSDPLVKMYEQGTEPTEQWRRAIRSANVAAQKGGEWLSTPMEWIDSYVADVLVRARYNENIRRGLSEEAAMADADAFAADVMADRSKGAMPTLFSQTNPLTKLLTQFQLEVNNQLSFVFKDLPREAQKKGKMALALRLLKFALGAYIFNELYEWLIGRRPALDPLGILNDTVGDITGYELDGIKVVETERTGVYDAGVNLSVSIVEELPFVGSLLGGGRLPISSAIPDFGKLWQAISDSDWDGKKRLATAAKELAKPATYLGLPFGGGQVKKAVEGISAVARGGSYSVDSKGDDLLQYPVHSSTPGEAGLNAVRAMIFGKSSLPEAREWVENDFDSLGVRQTEVYQTLRDSGVDTRQVYQTIRDWETVGNNDLLSSFERGIRQRKLVSEMAISDQQKLEVYHLLSGSNADSRVEKFQRMMDNGLTWSEIISAYDKQQELNTDEVLKASEKASLFAEWAFRNLTIEKALEVVNELKFYITMPANASQEDLTAALNETNLSVMEKRSVWADYSELYGWKAKSPW